jgi:myosin heavy subunit
MKAQMEKIGKGGAVIIALSMLSVGAIWVGVRNNDQLNAQLRDQKLKTEQSLAEKLSYIKDLKKSNEKLASMESTNASLTRLLDEKNREIAMKEAALRNNPDAATTKRLQGELNQLLKEKEGYVLTQQTLNDELARLREENKSLMAANVDLNKDKSELQANLEIAKSLTTENMELSAIKGRKEKLTVVARRTKKLEVGFDVPAGVAQSVRFVLHSPDGKVIEQSDSRMTKTINDETGAIYASISPLSGIYEQSKRVELCYKPEKKLEKGTYVVQIFNGETRLGSCRVFLR